MNRETTPSIPQLLQRAQVLYNADRLDEAAALYLWIMLEEPRHAPAHHMMGLMPHQKARNEEALQLIGHAIALDVRASEPQHDLAVVLGAMGRTDDSRAALEGLVVIAPDFPLGHYSLGTRLIEEKRWEEAGTALEVAVGIDLLQPEWWSNLSKMRLALGRIDGARAARRYASRARARRRRKALPVGAPAPRHRRARAPACALGRGRAAADAGRRIRMERRGQDRHRCLRRGQQSADREFVSSSGHLRQLPPELHRAPVVTGRPGTGGYLQARRPPLGGGLTLRRTHQPALHPDGGADPGEGLHPRPCGRGRDRPGLPARAWHRFRCCRVRLRRPRPRAVGRNSLGWMGARRPRDLRGEPGTPAARRRPRPRRGHGGAGRAPARRRDPDLGRGHVGELALQYIPFGARQRHLGPTSGSMGYAVPAAVAVSIVRPACIAVVLVGDGGFMMTGNELATAVHYGAAPIVVLFNNNMYGSVRANQERRFPGRVVATSLTNLGFADMARSFRAHGEVVTRTQRFGPAFERAVASGKPAVIEWVCDPEQLDPFTTLSGIRARALAAAT